MERRTGMSYWWRLFVYISKSSSHRHNDSINIDEENCHCCPLEMTRHVEHDNVQCHWEERKMSNIRMNEFGIGFDQPTKSDGISSCQSTVGSARANSIFFSRRGLAILRILECNDDTIIKKYSAIARLTHNKIKSDANPTSTMPMLVGNSHRPENSSVSKKYPSNPGRFFFGSDCWNDLVDRSWVNVENIANRK